MGGASASTAANASTPIAPARAINFRLIEILLVLEIRGDRIESVFFGCPVKFT
jgi:hypothetical protein